MKMDDENELKIWNSQIVFDILAQSPIKCSAKINPERGGDYDLNSVYITIDGCDDALTVTPFVDPAGSATGEVAPPENDNVPIYAIELRNVHSDSRGGCMSDNVDFCMLYGFLKAKLNQLDFYVIDHYDWIF
jgi:hypothetical protein